MKLKYGFQFRSSKQDSMNWIREGSTILSEAEINKIIVKDITKVYKENVRQYYEVLYIAGRGSYSTDFHTQSVKQRKHDFIKFTVHLTIHKIRW
jgi:hypothetical protein